MHGVVVGRQPRAQVALRARGRHGVQGWVGRWLGLESGLMCGVGVGGHLCGEGSSMCAGWGWEGDFVVGGHVLVCRGGRVA